MLLQIRGHHLPGRTWRAHDEQYDNVHVGIQVGKEPRELVRGDADTSSWTIPIEVVAREGELDYRGAAVQGRPGSRFVYLTWGDAAEDGSFTMFRRSRGCGHRRWDSPSRSHRERVPADFGDRATPPDDPPARTARAGPQPC
jgi:hypothetical protein